MSSAGSKRLHEEKEEDKSNAKKPKRESQNSMVIMCLGKHAALTRFGQERSLLMQQTFINPVTQHLSDQSPLPPLAIPFMPWTLTGSADGMLLYKPVAFRVSSSTNALIRMFTFSDLGTGRVQLVEQKFLALFSIFLWGMNKCSKQPFHGVWHNKKMQVQPNAFIMPPKIAGYVWKRTDFAPLQTDVYDAFNAKGFKSQHSSQICMSKLHKGSRACRTTPLANFVFLHSMCASCFVANCNGVTANMSALLMKKTPWRAKDAVDRIKKQHEPALMAILTTLKRLHLVAALDSEASCNVFLDPEINEQHGALVEQMPYCFPHVYRVREHAFAATTQQPLTAFGRFMFFGTRWNCFSTENKGLIESYRAAIADCMNQFANYGRAPVPNTLKPVPEDATCMLPIVRANNAVSTGLFPHHMFVVDEDFMVYSTAYVRVIHALASGLLKLTINLVPPLDIESLRPQPKYAKTVRKAASTKWLPNATSHPFIKVIGKKSGFWYAEEVRYEWLANILDLHALAADLKQVAMPRLIEVVLNGSYYKAATKITVLDREAHSSQPNIVVGGCFTELVDIGLDPKLQKLLATNAIKVQMHPDVCDPLTYDSSEQLHPSLKNDTVFGILRTENFTLQTEGASMFTNLVAFCDTVGCASPFEADQAYDAPPCLNANLVGTFLGMKQCFKGADMMGLTKPVVCRLTNALASGKLKDAKELYARKK